MTFLFLLFQIINNNQPNASLTCHVNTFSVPKLYEQALKYESGTAVTSTGALVCRSGKHTGRCPQDKRIVKEPSSEKEIWWGPINFPLSDHSFMINRFTLPLIHIGRHVVVH